MSFDDLKSAVASKSGLSKADASQAIIAFLDHLQASLCKGDKIILPDFGQFETTERAARQGRNPRTGEALMIAASRVVKFKAGKALKDAVNV